MPDIVDSPIAVLAASSLELGSGIPALSPALEAEAERGGGLRILLNEVDLLSGKLPGNLEPMICLWNNLQGQKTVLQARVFVRDPYS